MIWMDGGMKGREEGGENNGRGGLPGLHSAGWSYLAVTCAQKCQAAGALFTKTSVPGALLIAATSSTSN